MNDAYLDTPLSPFPFEDKSIDVGIFSHVLMHIPFEIVNYPMSEAARCCRTVVVKSVMHRYWPRKGTEFDPKWHCFEHDYEAICKEIGCTYSDYELFSQQELQGAYGFVFSSSA